jgi:ferredoxin
MARSADPPSPDQPVPWILTLDESACSMCEVCAQRCPSDALRIDQSGETLRLVYRPAICIGCEVDDSCQAQCPEDAILLGERRHPQDEAEELVLMQSELLHCSYCGAAFAPSRKLDSLSKKRQSGQALIRDLCPLCRRTQLVVGFIETRRAPGSTAKYRSTRDILRRAGYTLGDGKRGDD